MTDAVAARARRRTGPARSLTREQVVDVAIDVMSSQGLDAVSFRTVAMRLGVDPKALYTYVSDKDDLLAAMFDRVLAELDVPTADDPRPPAERIVGLLVSLRRTLIQNPDTLRLARPADVAGVDADAWERMAETLDELGIGSAVGLRVYGRLLRYTLGSAMYAPQKPLPHQPELAARVLDPDRHPKTLKLAQEQPFVEDEAEFASVIRLMLDRRVGEP